MLEGLAEEKRVFPIGVATGVVVSDRFRAGGSLLMLCLRPQHLCVTCVMNGYDQLRSAARVETLRFQR